MANFETGVSGYVWTQAVISVPFPVDAKGNRDIRCDKCLYFRRATRICELTHHVPEYPDKFVGTMCPLEEVDYEEIQTAHGT